MLYKYVKRIIQDADTSWQFQDVDMPANKSQQINKALLYLEFQTGKILVNKILSRLRMNMLNLYGYHYKWRQHRVGISLRKWHEYQVLSGTKLKCDAIFKMSL
jgi:hypothetical protein